METSRISRFVSHSTLKADPAVIYRVRGLHDVHIHEGFIVTDFFGTDRLEGLTIRKKAAREKISLPVKGVFIAIGMHPNSSLVSGLADLNERGEIIINPDCSTSRKGLYAAGDVTNAFGKRIIIASGEGAKAAMAARRHILSLRKKEAAKEAQA